jgi:pimeloyl-ACP methyl ester carboxylesterase
VAEISFRGVRAFYRTWGQGPPLILLHAGGSSGAQWTKTGDALADTHTLIAPDLISFGTSEPWPEAGGLTHELQADLVADIIETESTTPLDIVGHSYGGSTALRLALRRPELVRSLMLIEPNVSWLLKDANDPLYEEGISIANTFIASVQAGRPEVGWEYFIDGRNGAGTWARMSDQSRARFLAQSERVQEAFISNLNHQISRAECGRIGVPVTVACGALTTPTDIRISELVRDAITQAHYEIIPDAGHMSPFTHPFDIARLVQEHLERCRGQS